jgi:tetratricopeptide (TPR) repeat protein
MAQTARRYSPDEVKSFEQAYHAGRRLADAGSLEAAIDCFDQVLIRLPRRHRHRSYRIDKGGQLRQSAEDVQVLPTVFRDALLGKAFCLNEMGRFSAASKLLERAVELDPDNPRIYAELGFTHGSQDKLEQAMAAFSRAASLEPENGDHLRALAHIYLIHENFEEARLLAQQALALDPGSISSLHHLAYAEYRLGQLDAAIAALERAVTLAPTDAESVLRLAGTLRDCGRGREAIRRTAAYLIDTPDDLEAEALLTELLQGDGMAPELIPHAQHLLARDPQDTVALDLIAWGAYQQGQFTIAHDALRRLTALEPLQATHWFKLGMVQQALGHLAPAMAALLRALGLSDTPDLTRAAVEAISTLDHVQLETVVRRANSDARFRYQLRTDPDLTLRGAGFLFSPVGMQMLQAVDANPDALAMLKETTPAPH